MNHNLQECQMGPHLRKQRILLFTVYISGALRYDDDDLSFYLNVKGHISKYTLSIYPTISIYLSFYTKLFICSTFLSIPIFIRKHTHTYIYTSNIQSIFEPVIYLWEKNCNNFCSIIKVCNIGDQNAQE